MKRANNHWHNVIENIGSSTGRFVRNEAYSTGFLNAISGIDIYEDTVIAICWLPGSWQLSLRETIFRELKSTRRQSWSAFWDISYSGKGWFELWDFQEQFWNKYLSLISDKFLSDNTNKWDKSSLVKVKENSLIIDSNDNEIEQQVRHYLQWNNSNLFHWLHYIGDVEDAFSRAISTLYKWNRVEQNGMTTFIQWVNSFTVADWIKSQIKDRQLAVLKILITPDFWHAFENSIDVWQLDKSVKLMLEGWMDIFEKYILPALRDKDVCMTEFANNTINNLNNKQINEVIDSLMTNMIELSKEHRWDEHFREYLLSYISVLTRYFTNNLQ